MQRSVYLTGSLVLLGSLVIAWSVHNSAGSSGDSQHPQHVPEIDRIAASGFIDVEGGVVNMYPRQPGLVARVFAVESQRFKKDDVLLQIDDSLARLQLEEAQLALKNAERLEQEAQIDEKVFPHKLKQQESAAKAYEHSYNKVKAENEKAEKLLSEESSVTNVTRTMMKEGLAYVGALLAVEKEKLEELKLREPQVRLKVQEAKDHVELKQLTVKKAEEALELYKVRAPADGTVLRVWTQAGATLGTTSREPAIQFRPAGDYIVRAEVLQEWGHLVKEKQAVVIEDDVYQKRTWEGEVQSVSQWFAPTRSPVAEPFKMNDVRTLECLIRIKGGEQGLRIGQRMRVKIKV
jgi:multidrug resistance efflux pump